MDIDKVPISEKVVIIQRQTNYSETEANEKLVEYNYDHIKVIKKYLNIPEKKNGVVKSIQQEMYKQMRLKLDDSIRDFNLSQERKLQHDISSNEL